MQRQRCDNYLVYADIPWAIPALWSNSSVNTYLTSKLKGMLFIVFEDIVSTT
jgi:hypothetical protein